MFRSNLRADLPPQEFYQNIQNSKMSIARISPFCRLHVSLDKYDPNSSNQVVGENGNWTNSNESFPEDGGAEKHFEFWLCVLVNILNQSRICVEDAAHEKSKISHTKNPNFCTCSEIGDRSPTTAAGWCPSWLWKLLDTIFQTTQISWKLFGNTFYTSKYNSSVLQPIELDFSSPDTFFFWILWRNRRFFVKYFVSNHSNSFISKEDIYKLQFVCQYIRVVYKRYKGNSDLSIPTKKTMTTQKWINIRHWLSF